MTVGTAAAIVEKALRLITVLDQVESPTTEDLTLGTGILNDVIQHEFIDTMSGFQSEIFEITVPAGSQQFTIGAGGLLEQDARLVHWMRYGTLADPRHEIEEVTEREIYSYSSRGPLPRKFLKEHRLDGSLRITLWPTPSTAVPILVSLGMRVPAISDPTDQVMLPADVAHALSYVLGKRLRSEYGIPDQEITEVLAFAQQYEDTWKAHSMKNTTITLSRR